MCRCFDYRRCIIVSLTRRFSLPVRSSYKYISCICNYRYTKTCTVCTCALVLTCTVYMCTCTNMYSVHVHLYVNMYTVCTCIVVLVRQLKAVVLSRIDEFLPTNYFEN